MCFIPCRIPGFPKCCDSKVNKSQGILVYSACSNSYHWFIWIICWVRLLAPGVIVEMEGESSSFWNCQRAAEVPKCQSVSLHSSGRMSPHWVPSLRSPSVQKKPLMTRPLHIRFYHLFSGWLPCPFGPCFVWLCQTQWNSLLWMVIPLLIYLVFPSLKPEKLQNYYSLSVGSFWLKGETQFKLV